MFSSSPEEMHRSGLVELGLVDLGLHVLHVQLHVQTCNGFLGTETCERDINCHMHVISIVTVDQLDL